VGLVDSTSEMDKVAMEEDIHEIGEEEKEKLNDLDWESTAYRYSLICRACLCSAVIQIPREGYSWNCKKRKGYLFSSYFPVIGELL